jgi:hypothetical protein
MISKHFNLRRLTICVSVILLALSLTQPAFYIGSAEPDAWANSVMLFFMGWSAVMGNLLMGLIWLANPLYLMSIRLSIKKNRKASVVSLIAASLAFSFSLLDTISVSDSGGSSEITSLEAGYWLWLASFFVMALGTAISELLEKKTIR